MRALTLWEGCVQLVMAKERSLKMRVFQKGWMGVYLGSVSETLQASNTPRQPLQQYFHVLKKSWWGSPYLNWNVSEDKRHGRASKSQMATEHEKEYIAGFTDGDGCIRIPHPTSKRKWPVPIVYIAQSMNGGTPPELCFVQEKFGGNINARRKSSENVRTQWALQLTGLWEVEEFVEDMQSRCVIKRVCFENAHEYLRSGRLDPLDAHRVSKESNSNYQDVPILEERLTLAYIAGLFAAEGCIDANWRASRTGDPKKSVPRIRATIRQSGCVGILHAIKDKLGMGSVSGGKLSFQSNEALRFLELVRPFMAPSQKRDQVDAVVPIVKPGCNRKRSAQEIEAVCIVAERLKELKKR